MEIKVSRVYTFPSGAEIDLKKVIMIGSIDKDEDGNILFAIHVEKKEKPILFKLGWAIGSVPSDEKNRIYKILGDFKEEWRQYKLQEEDKCQE